MVSRPRGYDMAQQWEQLDDGNWERCDTFPAEFTDAELELLDKLDVTSE